MYAYALPDSNDKAELWDLDNMGKVNQFAMDSTDILDHNLKGIMMTSEDVFTLCWLILYLILTF